MVQEGTGTVVSDSDPRTWVQRLRLLWWVLAIAGCVAVVASPWLAWVSNSDGGTTISINGFNGLAADNLLSAIQPGGADTTQTGDGTVPPLPSLSSIPETSGGTDAHAKYGVFVLVLGATSLFIALWTLWGEVERRRSMARIVFVLSALTLIPLLRDLFNTITGSSVIGTSSVGAGIIVGVGGAVATMIGATLQYRALGRVPTPG